MKFMKHSHRDKLSTEDVNSALRLQKVEVILLDGYSLLQSLYGYSFRDPIRFLRAAGHKELFFREDKELDFAEIVGSPLPPCPRESSFHLHWLAVNGVQPSIPQNPVVITGENAKPEDVATVQPTTTTVQPTSVTTTTPEAGKVTIKPSVKHTLSRELQLYFEKVTEAVTNLQIKTASNRAGQTEKKDIYTHSLFGETTKSAVNFFEAARNSVAGDPGLHQLVPYFTRFLSTEIKSNLQNLGQLHALLRLLDALINNPHLQIDLYLHQIMPLLLTCLVGKQLCKDPSEDDHWSLREYSASIIASVCSRYENLMYNGLIIRFGDRYQDLQPRVTKTLVHAFLDFTRPLSTIYGLQSTNIIVTSIGAIVGLTNFGSHCVELVVVPNITKVHEAIAKKCETGNVVTKMEAERCYQALLVC